MASGCFQRLRGEEEGGGRKSWGCRSQGANSANDLGGEGWKASNGSGSSAGSNDPFYPFDGTRLAPALAVLRLSCENEVPKHSIGNIQN